MVVPAHLVPTHLSQLLPNASINWIRIQFRIRFGQEMYAVGDELCSFPEAGLGGSEVTTWGEKKCIISPGLNQCIIPLHSTFPYPSPHLHY